MWENLNKNLLSKMSSIKIVKSSFIICNSFLDFLYCIPHILFFKNLFLYIMHMVLFIPLVYFPIKFQNPPYCLVNRIVCFLVCLVFALLHQCEVITGDWLPLVKVPGIKIFPNISLIGWSTMIVTMTTPSYPYSFSLSLPGVSK